MSPYKMKLLKLPIYLEKAIYIVDHRKELSMNKKLEVCMPQMLEELENVINNIEKVFTHNNSIYLKENQLKMLFEIYEDAVHLLSRLQLGSVGDLLLNASKEEKI